MYFQVAPLRNSRIGSCESQQEWTVQLACPLPVRLIAFTRLRHKLVDIVAGVHVRRTPGGGIEDQVVEGVPRLIHGRHFPRPMLRPAASFGAQQTIAGLPSAAAGVRNRCSTEDRNGNQPALGKGCWFAAERRAIPLPRSSAARGDSSRRCERFPVSRPCAPRRAQPWKRSPVPSDPLAGPPTAARSRSSPEWQRPADPPPVAVVPATTPNRRSE